MTAPNVKETAEPGRGSRISKAFLVGLVEGAKESISSPVVRVLALISGLAGFVGAIIQTN